MIIGMLPSNSRHAGETNNGMYDTLVNGFDSKQELNLDPPQMFSKNFRKSMVLFNVRMVVPRVIRMINGALRQFRTQMRILQDVY